MKERNFEGFMMDRHASQFIGTRDAMVDDFDSWLEGLSSDDWLDYGEDFKDNELKRIKT